MTVPMPIPPSTHSAAPPQQNKDTSLKRHIEDDLDQSDGKRHHDEKHEENSGAILATMIS